MNGQKQIDTMTDLDLAEAVHQQYQVLMQAQQNIIMVNNEIAKRKVATIDKGEPDGGSNQRGHQQDI